MNFKAFLIFWCVCYKEKKQASFFQNTDFNIFMAWLVTHHFMLTGNGRTANIPREASRKNAKKDTLNPLSFYLLPFGNMDNDI